jgi:hypothetical protein
MEGVYPSYKMLSHDSVHPSIDALRRHNQSSNSGSIRAGRAGRLEHAGLSKAVRRASLRRWRPTAASADSARRK